MGKDIAETVTDTSVPTLLPGPVTLHMISSPFPNGAAVHGLQFGADGRRFDLAATVPASSQRRFFHEGAVIVGTDAMGRILNRPVAEVQKSQVEVAFMEPDGTTPVSEAQAAEAQSFLVRHYHDDGQGYLRHFPHGAEYEATFDGEVPDSLKEGLIELSVRQLEFSRDQPETYAVWLETKKLLAEKFFQEGEAAALGFLANLGSTPPNALDLDATPIVGPKENPALGVYVTAVTRVLYDMIRQYRDYRPAETTQTWNEIAGMLFGDPGRTIDDLLDQYGDMRMWILNALHDSTPLLQTPEGFASEKYAMNMANLAMHFRTTLNAGCASGPLFLEYSNGKSDLREDLRMLMPTSMPADEMFDFEAGVDHSSMLLDMLDHVLAGHVHTVDRAAGTARLVNNADGSIMEVPTMHGDYRVRVAASVDKKWVRELVDQYRATDSQEQKVAIMRQLTGRFVRFEYTSRSATPDVRYKGMGSMAVQEMCAVASALAMSDRQDDVFTWLAEREMAIHGEDGELLFSPDAVIRTGLTQRNWEKAQRYLQGGMTDPDIDLEFRQMQRLIQIVDLAMIGKGFDQSFFARSELAREYVDAMVGFDRSYYGQFTTATEVFDDYTQTHRGNWGEMLLALDRMEGETSLRQVLQERFGFRYDQLVDLSRGELVLRLNNAFTRQQVYAE